MQSTIDTYLQQQREENAKIEEKLSEIKVQVGIVCSAINKSGKHSCRRVGKENASLNQTSSDEWNCLVFHKEQLDQLTCDLQTVQTEGSHQQRLLNYAHCQTHTRKDVPLPTSQQHCPQDLLQLVIDQNAKQERNCHTKEEIQNNINQALRHLSKRMLKLDPTESDNTNSSTHGRKPFAERGNVKE